MQTLPTLNTGLQATGSLLKGVAGLNAGEYNAGVYYGQAQEQLIAGNQQATMLRDQAQQVIGEQAAGQYGSGFAGGTGTAVQSLEQSQINATLDMMNLRRDAQMKARSLVASGDAARTTGAFALAQGLIGAAGDVTKSVQDWAAARAGQTMPAKVAPPDTSGISVTRGRALPVIGAP
jgi:hypothetical protein